MIKKYILGVLVALAIPIGLAYAATPSLMVTGNGDNDNVTVTVTGGEPNAQVVLFYNQNQGNIQTRTIGTTDAGGGFSGIVSTSVTGVGWNTPVYVQVGGYQSSTVTWPFNGTATNSTAGGVSFSQIAPSFGLGQTATIILSGGSGSYYVSSNSNTNGVLPTISGNALTVYGASAGQANIVICSTGGGCGTVMATVGNVSTPLGAPILNQSVVNVNQNGQGTITLSGGTAPYTISVPSGSGVSTTLVGNTLYINGGATTGVNTIQVCSANGAGCAPLTVNVQTAGVVTTTSTPSVLSFTLPLSVGTPAQVQLTGGSGSYYLASPMSSPALASITGSMLTLNGSAIGNGTVMVCSTSGGACLPIAVSVGPGLTGTGGGYFYDTDLTVGMSGQDVMELQTRLKEEGYFTATPTGYFGPLTQSAVMAYQSAHGISATGYVGPITRSQLNQ